MRPVANSAPARSAPTLLPLLVLLIGALSIWRIWVISHSGITLYVDEAQYWDWAQHLDWGYFSKPPLVAALIAATTAAFGDGILGVKAGSLILYPATGLLLYGLGRRLYDERTGAITAFAFLTLPITAALGLFVSTDALLLFFWTAALWTLNEALASKRVRDWALLGLVCGLGLMAKYTMAAFALTVLTLLLATPDGRRQLRTPGPWLCAAVALLVLAPNLWWNAQHDFPTFRHTADIARIDGGRDNSSNLLEFVGAQIGSIGPLLAIGFFAALFGLRSAWARPADRLLIAGSLPLLLLVSAQAIFGHANANWAGPIFCGGTLLAVAWLDRSGPRRKLLVAALVVNFLIGAVVYHWPSVLALADRPLTAKLDPFKRMKGWNALAQGIAPFIAEHPDAYVVSDQRTLLSHVAYALRSQNPRIASWNPGHTVLDHYQLTSSLPNQPGIDVLFLSDEEPGGATRRFASAEKIAAIRVRTHPDFALRTGVWLLRGFKGY